MDSGDEDELTTGGRDFHRMSEGLRKAGYREGATKGKEIGMQKSFDLAYSCGLRHSIRLGRLKGLIQGTIQLHPETEGTLFPLLEKVETLSDLPKTSKPKVNCTESSGSGSTDLERVTEELTKEWESELQSLLKEFASILPQSASLIQTLFKS